MSKDIKHSEKCCETCLNRAIFSNRYMCCKDLSECRLIDSVPKELPDEHICDKYSPDIANNPSLREPKSDNEISGFMDIFHEIGNIEPYWIHACTRISDICDAIQRTINETNIDLTALRKYTKEIGALSDYLETMREDKE